MWWIYYDGKSTLKHFGFINLHQDFKMGKNVAWTTMDVIINKITGEKKRKIYIQRKIM